MKGKAAVSCRNLLRWRLLLTKETPILGFACAVFAALLFAAASGHETGRPGPQVLEYIPLTPPPEYAFGCQAPGEGLWRFQNNFQVGGPDTPHVPAAVAEVTLVRVGNNAYNGNTLPKTRHEI